MNAPSKDDIERLLELAGEVSEAEQSLEDIIEAQDQHRINAALLELLRAIERLNEGFQEIKQKDAGCKGAAGKTEKF